MSETIDYRLNTIRENVSKLFKLRFSHDVTVGRKCTLNRDILHWYAIFESKNFSVTNLNQIF